MSITQAVIKAWHLKGRGRTDCSLGDLGDGVGLLFADTGRYLEAAAGGIEGELKAVDVSSKAGVFSHQELATA